MLEYRHFVSTILRFESSSAESHIIFSPNPISRKRGDENKKNPHVAH